MATAANQSAAVSWLPPPGIDPSLITSYTVTPLPVPTVRAGIVVPSAVTVAGNLTSVTVTGLSNGGSYGFEVSATDALGTGPLSALSNVVTPFGPPIGNPENSGNNPVQLGTLNCNQSLSESGTSANDGSVAWYVVTLTEPDSRPDHRPAAGPCSACIPHYGRAGRVRPISGRSWDERPYWRDQLHRGQPRGWHYHNVVRQGLRRAGDRCRGSRPVLAQLPGVITE